MIRTSRLAHSWWLSVALSFSGVACSTEGARAPADGGSDTGIPRVVECADAAPEGSSGSFFPCDVEAILVAKCQRCHNSPAVLADCYPKGTCEKGPFPLLVWSDTRRDIGGTRPLDAIAQVVASGFMPFQSTRLTEPVAKLTPAEKQTLIRWVEACAPPSATVCADSGSAPAP